MASELPQPSATPMKDTPTQCRTHTRTVLLIGNTEENGEVLKPILEALGCRVVIVPTHGRALEVIYEHCPTLLLIDASVPSRAPLAYFIATVRSRYAKLRIGLIGKTGDAVAAGAADAALGDFHLSTPLQMEESISMLERWLAPGR